MKKRISKFINHPLISGSTIVFVGSFISNLLNWLFNLFIGGRHLLSVTDYGIYSSLIAFSSLFGIFAASFTTIFAKFSAVYTIEGKDNKSVHSLLFNGAKIVVFFGSIILFVLLVLNPFLASFLHLKDVSLLFLISFTIFISILSSLPIGVLQGELRFFILSFFNILTPLLKIIIGFFLLFLGFKVFGVIAALFLSSFITFIVLILVFLPYYSRVKAQKQLITESIFLKEFRKYSLRFFLATVSITILTSTDVMFVRHFFSPEKAGQYAALSIMGKSIFYFTSPIYFVFFPLIASKKEKKESLYDTLLLGIGIITLFSISLSFIYFLFPNLVLGIFFPAKEYSSLSPYLGPFSLYIVVFSIAILFNNFLLSIGKIGIYKINLLVSVIFIFLIYIFHNSFYQVIGILFVTSFLLLISHLLYYFLLKKAEFNQNEKK